MGFPKKIRILSLLSLSFLVACSDPEETGRPMLLISSNTKAVNATGELLAKISVNAPYVEDGTPVSLSANGGAFSNGDQDIELTLSSNSASTLFGCTEVGEEIRIIATISSLRLEDDVKVDCVKPVYPEPYYDGDLDGGVWDGPVGDWEAPEVVTGDVEPDDRQDIAFTGDPDRPWIEITSESDSTMADGVSTVAITACAYRAVGEPWSGADVTFSSTFGTFAESGTIEAEVSTGSDGCCKATLIGGTAAGTAKVEARIQEIKASTNVSVVALGSISFVSVTPTRLGVKYSGWNENAEVVFRVQDAEGNPMPDGMVVNFILNSATGGVSLTQSYAESFGGLVRTTLVSGKTATGVSVKATATVGLTHLEVDSPTIPIVGAKPTARGFPLICDLYNVGAFINKDEVNSTVISEFYCRTLLKDRFSNPVGVATSVSFRTEAGAVGGSIASIPYDETKDPDVPQPDVGKVSIDFHTDGKLPQDVDPWDFEPQWTDSFGHTYNPRDGFVTLIAWTSGEEEFDDTDGDGRYTDTELFDDANGNLVWDEGEESTDTNGNGVWDPGEDYTDVNGNGVPDNREPFVDLGEPFVDMNDNNIRDTVPVVEPFIDMDPPNGRYDGPNGRWDSNTLIWTQTRILYSGNPKIHPETHSRWVLGTSDACGMQFCVGNDWGLAVQADLYWMDENFNPVNVSATYTVSLTLSNAKLVGDTSFQVEDHYGCNWSLETRRSDGIVGRIESTMTACYGQYPIATYFIQDSDPNVVAVPAMGNLEAGISYKYGPAVAPAGTKEDSLNPVTGMAK